MRLSIHLCSLDNVLTFAQFIDTMFTSVVNSIHFCSHFTHCSPFSSLCAPLHPATCVQIPQFIYPLSTPLVTFSHFPFGFGLGSHMYTSTVCSPLCLLCASLNKHTHFNFTCASLLFTFFTLFTTALFG